MFKRALCWLLGHKWYTIKRYSNTTKIGCHRCHKAWSMDDRVKLLEWDGELEDLHEGPLILDNKV